MTQQVSPSASPTNLGDLDEQAFSALAEPHRRELQVHCYRMLGALQEAEDAVQETLLRAWRRRETYVGRAPFRAWLYRIATNICLDALKQRARRSLPMTQPAADSPDGPIPQSITEPIWLEPFPDSLLASEETNPEAQYSRRESVTLALMTSLHLLPPRQRAALILRDVLDWPTGEVAELLDQSVSSVKSSLHRARATLARHHQTPHFDDMSPRRLEGRLRTQLDRYVQAWETADVDGLLALLVEDATFSMPPVPAWYRGRDAIGVLVRKTVFDGPAHGRWRLRPIRANGQPGFGLYRKDENNGVYDAYGIQVVTFDGGHITDITIFVNPALMSFFNLPAIWSA